MATTYNESQALAGGTLYYTVDVISGTCYYTGATPPKPVSFTTYDYEIFSYTDSNSLSWGLSGSGSYNYVNNPYGGVQGRFVNRPCPRRENPPGGDNEALSRSDFLPFSF